MKSVRAVLRVLPAMLAGSFASGAFALELTEADFLDDLPVVLSVSRLSQPVNEAPAAVTIIDQDMIRASGFRDIPDLLRLVPGFVVSYTRDNTWAAGYHGLGDAYSRRFQVLVDGRSIYSPQYGEVYWNDLPLAMEDIERIEVIRGPNAAIHGANAFAAVINIITKTAAQVPGTFISTQLGEESMGGLIVRHGGGNDSLRYRLTLSTQSRDRFERDVTYKSIKSQENGAYYEASQTAFLNGRLDWQSSASSDVSLQFGLSQGDRDAGRDIVDPLGVLEPREQDSRAFYVQLAYHKVESLQREWRLNAYFSRNRFDANALVDLGGLGIGVVDVNQYLSQSRSNVEL
jgi:iron complex outermembrane receptor protein